MARLSRLSAASQLHLVSQRGHNSQAIAVDDVDRQSLVDALREASAVHGVAIHALAVLTDRIELLVTPASDGGLSKMMQALGRRYVARYNLRHGRSGTLWEGRFRAAIIEPGNWAIAAMLFVDRRAQDLGLCEPAQAYAWSSASHHVGKGRNTMLVDPPDYWTLGNTPFDREARYELLLASGATTDELATLESAARNNWAVGSTAFLADLAQKLGRPLQPRPRGRPRRTAQR
jgi:putative transposase